METEYEKPEVLAAIKRMEDNTPVKSKEFIESLGGTVEGGIPGIPCFRGWIGRIDGIQPIHYLPVHFPEDADLENIDYVSFWVLWSIENKPRTAFVVSMPSFIESKVPEGATVEVGLIGIRAETPQEEVESIVREGYLRLQAFIAKEGPSGNQP